MTYTTSVNIEIGIDDNFQYIVTPNVQRVLGDIVSSIQVGVHSFSIIGTYGIGKSTFLIALEEGLQHNSKKLLTTRTVFFGLDKFTIVNVVGEFKSLKSTLAKKFTCDEDAVLDTIKSYCKKEESKGKGVFLVIDEFGKALEHAAKNNPEEELYFIQQLCEIINDSRRKAVLLTTLHQNFGAYSHKLTDEQRKEWQKVKGRFKEVVFNEPVEQLLYLAAEQLETERKFNSNPESFVKLYNLAKKCKYISDSFTFDTANKLYPMDPLAANCLTLAIQRYGQNERSLFSFLSATGKYSLNAFEPSENNTYNLACVYDYLIYNFYSSISEVNIDSTNWSALRDAINRVENGVVEEQDTEDAIKIVKTIGLLNIFAAANTSLDLQALTKYSKTALDIAEPERIIKRLEDAKLIRFANYKSKYIIFEGTDINIETELLRAATIVPVPNASVDELKDYISPRVSLASAAYYKTGTPRYFEFVLKNEPDVMVPEGDIDGYCELVFPLDKTCEAATIEQSKSNPNANIYAVFQDVASLTKHLHEIKKLQYLLDNIAIDDKVARREILNIQEFEKDKLNSILNDYLFTENGSVKWVFKGQTQMVHSRRDFNAMLSRVCESVYPSTPTMRNELFNKHKLSSAISLAKSNLLDAIISNYEVEDFGFDKAAFPPEKTIYLSLLKNTGIHRETKDGWFFMEPTDKGFAPFYKACEEFIARTAEKPKKVSDLIKMLLSRPYKLKQGFVDIWVPIFLFMMQQDYALYSSNGAYIPNLSKEVFELIWKKPSDFTIKAFNVEGIRLEFFKKYRQFLHQDDSKGVTKITFAQTYKPFLHFYKNLNEYAKTTRKFNDPGTARFRDTLGNASDPEKAFFEDLPEALGYKSGNLTKNDEFIADYLNKIQKAVRELNGCYPALIQRIEDRMTEQLGLPASFEDYKPVINERYASVKSHLLAQKAKTFLDRILAPSESSREFIEKIASVILDRRLEQMKDKEEESVIDNIIFLFRELDRYTSISSLTDGNTEDMIFSFDLSSNHGVNEQQKAYRLPKIQVSKAAAIEEKITELLSGDENLDVCILLNLLSNRIGK